MHRRTRPATLPSYSLRILWASLFMTTLPSVTCPSPPMADLAVVADGQDRRRSQSRHEVLSVRSSVQSFCHGTTGAVAKLVARLVDIIAVATGPGFG